MSFGSVSLIGSGNVASHLAELFTRASIQVSLYSRNKEAASDIARRTDCELLSGTDQIDPLSLVLLCVKDDVVNEILSQLPADLAVAYTSGTVALQDLSPRNKLGVFYPLQSFTKGRELAQVNFPVLLEANHPDFLRQLIDLGRILTGNVHQANSSQRRELHISAVLANNFVNHLWHLSQQHLEGSGQDWNLLLPLIQESVHKLELMSAFDAQTGPAVRYDQHTIEEHLKRLDGKTAAIYRLLTESIQDTYKSHKND